MKKHKHFLVVLLIGLTALALVIILIHAHRNFDVLNPQGIIAEKQRNLIYFTLALSLIVVIPVYAMTIGLAWRYRASNKKATYAPDWDRNSLYETIWWGIPITIIAILAVVTWNTSHSLDPFKPLNSAKAPVTVQVVALQWKWLFIYPEEHVASLNYFAFPAETPLNLEITSDAPMNSFWLPQLGGQIYAMSGMSTQLHLMANHAGVYRGSSANISGKGFANMHFRGEAMSDRAYGDWLSNASRSPKRLTTADYALLAKASTNSSETIYSGVDDGLYNGIVMKYMQPGNASVANMEGM